jgi:manganese transport protein
MAQRVEVAQVPAASPSARSRVAVAMLGPAVVASVAYVDPGNFATNIEGGARYGYRLLWVVVLASTTAMLVQYLSAKLGLVTGCDLAQLCRDRASRPVVIGLWLQAEAAAMATDVAEFVGAAVALNLLFHLPLLASGVVTAAAAFAVLAVQQHSHRRFEAAIAGLLVFVVGGFLYETLRITLDAGKAAAGLVPTFSGAGSVTLAVGIVGATVMPHAVYAHSALTANHHRRGVAGTRTVGHERMDVVIALGLAGLVNAAMLTVAARLLSGKGGAVATLVGAHRELASQVGGLAALSFAVALLAAGISSSGVGTYAGQVVMAGFLRRRLPIALRRAVTMLPALVVLAVGTEPTDALVLSQVVLSFCVPFALVPLVVLTSRRSVMGRHVNAPVTLAAASLVTVVIVALNVYLLVAHLS